MTEKEFRLVAYILPEKDGWGLGQINESDMPRIATIAVANSPIVPGPNQYLGYVFCKVGPPSGVPNGRMIYDYNVKIVEAPPTLLDWQRILQIFESAIKKPPLYREDFTHIFED